MRVRGPVSPRVVSGDRMAALAAGNIDELLRINRAEFGGATMMADDDDDDDDDADDDDNDDTGSGGSDDDDGADDDDKNDKSSDDLEALRKRMKAADKRAADAEKRLKEQEDAKKDDLTKAQDRVTELEEREKELTSQVNDLRLENAFLTANAHDWHDPDIARKIAETKGYLEDVVDDDGDVDKSALKKALDRLAKEHSYLVKKVEKNDDDDGNPSGESGGRRSDNLKDEKVKKEQLRRRFPVIR